MCKEKPKEYREKRLVRFAEVNTNKSKKNLKQKRPGVKNVHHRLLKTLK